MFPIQGEGSPQIHPVSNCPFLVHALSLEGIGASLSSGWLAGHHYIFLYRTPNTRGVLKVVNSEILNSST